MKITTRQLKRIIREEASRLLEYEVYVDEKGYAHDDEGNSWYVGKGYGGGTYAGTRAPWSGRRGPRAYRDRKPSQRKTTYVGADANAEKIVALESAIAAKPNNFLSSLLSQLKKGRGLSEKQKSIARKILMKKPYASMQETMTVVVGDERRSAPSLLHYFFEGNVRKVTTNQLRKMIREEAAIIDHGSPDEVEMTADAWSGGDNLDLSIDHSKAVGSEAVTAEPEILSITESELRKTIRLALKG